MDQGEAPREHPAVANVAGDGVDDDARSNDHGKVQQLGPYFRALLGTPRVALVALVETTRGKFAGRLLQQVVEDTKKGINPVFQHRLKDLVADEDEEAGPRKAAAAAGGKVFAKHGRVRYMRSSPRRGQLARERRASGELSVETLKLEFTRVYGCGDSDSSGR